MDSDPFFGDDLPKENPWTEDRLGFTPTAERLATVIANLKAPNGYVIGLHGEWGSGKSTLLNFVKAYLDEWSKKGPSQVRRASSWPVATSTASAPELSTIKVLEFQPWIVSGHQDMVAAFFKVLSEDLSPRLGWWKRQGKRLLRLLRLTTDPVADLAAKLAITVDPALGGAVAPVASLTKKSVNGMIDRFLADPSLQRTYEELKKALRKSKQRFLIVIDDLDRLRDDEIRSIMQLVKTVGRLPNVVYLLAYDRAIVWRALDGKGPTRGPRFAEKIVQQEIELPQPTKDALLSILDSELKFLVAGGTDSLRWIYIVEHGVRRWIRHPRDVLRLANAIKFSWPNLKNEIDWQDLLAMDGLRLFDPVAFAWVRWNRDFLFNAGRFQYSTDEAQEAIVEELRDRLPEQHRDDVLRLLTVLFPSKAKWFGHDKDVIAETHVETMNRRGVGCEAGFDAYFHLHPSPDAIPKSVIDQLVEGRFDQQEITETLTEYLSKRSRSGKPLISALLTEVITRFNARKHASPDQAILQSVLQTGDVICAVEGTGDLFEPTPGLLARRLVGDLLKLWGQRDAGSHLLKAFQDVGSIALKAQIYIDRACELGVIPSDSPSPPCIEQGHLALLGSTLLSQIEHAAAAGHLSTAPALWGIIDSWKQLGGSAPVKAWIMSNINDLLFADQVAKTLLSESFSDRGRKYSLRNNPDEAIYDLPALLAACKRHLQDANLKIDQRERLEALAKGLDRWRPSASA